MRFSLPYYLEIYPKNDDRLEHLNLEKSIICACFFVEEKNRLQSNREFGFSLGSLVSHQLGHQVYLLNSCEIKGGIEFFVFRVQLISKRKYLKLF